MEVIVDASLCQGHARCVIIQPELFVLDDDGFAAVRGQPDETQRAAFEEAARNCPERAIAVVS